MKKISFGQTTVSLFEIDKPGGNKYYKLKYNLVAAKQAGLKTLLSFGGAWSNHLHALAQLGSEEGFRTIGVIRGEKPKCLSAMLEDVQKVGMQLVFVTRQKYREKESPEFMRWLKNQFGEFYLLPEGGTNDLAVAGCTEIITSFESEDYDLICIPVGTGGTLAGIAKSLRPPQSVLGFSVLKGAKNLDEKVAALLEADTEQSDIKQPDLAQTDLETDLVETAQQNWSINHQFHCGGYAKCPDYLKEFVLHLESEYEIRLDPVYTGKMLYGIHRLLEDGGLHADLKIIAIHTGGLQGRRGYDF
ncbi:MAG: pyridoxal-phosphate dependent enzyme [Pseudomonadales bacterium]|nr:pyridoxal-phosphate dependent enzyme [Pseudomonadales bacterium]